MEYFEAWMDNESIGSNTFWVRYISILGGLDLYFTFETKRIYEENDLSVEPTRVEKLTIID